VDPLAELLRRSAVIAVVGKSTDPAKAAHQVPMAMAAHGYTIVPVHLTATSIGGLIAYPSLAQVPVPIDLVDVFRPAAEAPEVARQAVAVGARALWLQLGIVSAEARAVAQAAGLDYVEDRCLAVERQRLGVVPG